MNTSTFPDLLTEQLRSDASRPLVTFYDDATGERVELSVTSYANWVSKTAGLLQDELDVEHGDLVLVDLPTHWLGPVWLGAVWTQGALVTTDPARSAEARAILCGPAGVATYRGVDSIIIAASLRPLGAPFADPLPDGLLDYGAVVPAQPDAFVAAEPPAPDDVAWVDGDRRLTHRELMEEARHNPLVEPRGRLLTDLNPCSPAGLAALVSPLAQGGGTIWVANPDAAAWERRYAEERATAHLTATPIRLR